MATWALQDAKARFSELVEKAKCEGPQTVTKHGRAAVLVVAVAQFRELMHGQRQDDLAMFFSRSPLRNLDLAWLERDGDTGREVRL